jgi:hAT family C-terminal dimerisation region
MPIQDNSTRWNSTYNSLHRALKIKTRLQLFCLQYPQEVKQDMLSDEDWNHLTEIHTGLRPFHEATLRCEGNARTGHHGAIWEALPLLEAQLKITEEGRQSLSNSRRGRSPLAITYNNAWEKLTKYYNLTDKCHSIYAAALLLHPSYRKRFFDDYWIGGEIEAWKPVMIKSVKQVWEREYRKAETAQEVNYDYPEPDILDRYLQTPQVVAQGDAFDSFINSPTTQFRNDSDIFSWWNSEANPHKGVRQHALNLLSIPAMSAEIERVFSDAKRMLTPDRNRLNDETLEYLELLRYWWRKNIITQRT